MAKLTTTSYAILGLLKRRPWSAYELTKYMQHSGIRAVWPRTESRIYVEFKNLLAHGLATVAEETHKGRKRAIYSITLAGGASLRDWLLSAEGGLRLESEPLLKLLYSDLDKSAPGVQLESMRQQLLAEARLMRDEIEAVLERGFFFEENAEQNAQLVALLTDFVEVRSRWLQQMSAKPVRSTSRSKEARRVYHQQAEKLDKLLAELGGAD